MGTPLTAPGASTEDRWTSGVDSLLVRWLKRARENQFQHWESARYYENANYLLGIPVVVLSSAVFQTQIAVGAISVLAAILASLQTFLHFSERAERHRGVAASYAAVRRRIEVLLSLPLQLRGSAADVVGDIEKQLDGLSERAPNVPRRIWKKMAQAEPLFPNFLTYPEVARPNATTMAPPTIAHPQEGAASSAQACDPYHP
jgi:hypothetical protein